MWIGGLTQLNKPYLHLNTQFNRNIPFKSIDMNFMNTNQSAHGDREHGFITARLRMKRKVICGYWEDAMFRIRMGGWMRSAVGAMFSRQLKSCVLATICGMLLLHKVIRFRRKKTLAGVLILTELVVSLKRLRQ